MRHVHVGYCGILAGRRGTAAGQLTLPSRARGMWGELNFQRIGERSQGSTAAPRDSYNIKRRGIWREKGGDGGAPTTERVKISN